MKILFYDDATTVAFETPAAMILEVFDYARLPMARVHEDKETTIDLFEKLLGNSEPLEGEYPTFQRAYLSFLQGVQDAPENRVGEMRQSLEHDPALVYSLIRAAPSRDEFLFVTMDDEEEFDKNLQLHKLMLTPMGRA
jgi:hypothetical protein